ncbi:hypothetical protein EJ02DRAFT_456911 [Clathrospora elynae]|uniref:Uncharacterized protein n=1 Tax=Clathrospora elynae TaxID=706981 RepID=A0A6A5SJB0_9PLEO|nr:hypothetical protein EJ02DRAFT_456911 [Clathrospora elynae]
MNPASLSSALSPRDPRSSLRTLVLYYMQALCKEVVLPSMRIAKMGNLLHSTVQYERGELKDIRWIDGRDNPADALTKATANASMEQLINTNELEL